MKIVDLKKCSQHIQQLAEWHHAQWSDINPGQTLQQRIEKMRHYLNDGFVPSTFVAIENDEPRGSAAIVEYDMKIEGCTPWLASVYVDKLYRNQGLGSKLVFHVIEKARLNNVKTLYLFTPDRTSFYQRLGWEIRAIEPYYGKDVTIMHYNVLESMNALSSIKE